MQSLVVLSALLAAACGSLLPLAQPVHHPAIVLDPHGRPLDTAAVIEARALHLQAKALEGHHAPQVHSLVAHAPLVHAVAAPTAVSHQSRVDVRTSPAVVSHSVLAAPIYGSHAGLALSHGHYLHKRSLAHLVAPVVHAAPSAVSHQSRVDVISSPAVVSHSVVAPVVSHAPVVAHAAAPIAPAAVSHQSRVDVRTSPAVASHSVLAAPIYGSHAGLALSHGHYLHKRSLAHLVAPVVHAAPSAVSHQSRLDVISSPAVVSHSVVAPVISHAPVVAHAAPLIAHAAVSHQSSVDVRTSPAVVSHSVVAPLAHSAVWSAPSAYVAHSGILNSHAALAHW